jgi:glycopeptide antibiotics resistance protein
LKYLESHKLWRFMLAAMLVPLTLIAFWPNPVDAPVQGQLADVLKFLHAHEVPAWVNYQFVEASANVILFVPVGVTAGLAYPRRRWWQIGILGLFVSVGIELGQLFFLHNRFASLGDIVTNTGGAVIGALLASLVLRWLQDRRLSATVL